MTWISIIPPFLHAHGPRDCLLTGEQTPVSRLYRIFNPSTILGVILSTKLFYAHSRQSTNGSGFSALSYHVICFRCFLAIVHSIYCIILSLHTGGICVDYNPIYPIVSYF